MVVRFHMNVMLNTGNVFNGSVEVKFDMAANEVRSVKYDDVSFEEFEPGFDDNLELNQLIDKKVRQICFGE